MTKGLHVPSEIGKLRKVCLHRPGDELLAGISAAAKLGTVGVKLDALEQADKSVDGRQQLVLRNIGR